MNCAYFTSVMVTAAIRPLNTPKTPANTVRMGSMTIAAISRGTINTATGSKASVSSASICSVTRIVAISAVILAPTRPASTSP